MGGCMGLDCYEASKAHAFVVTKNITLQEPMTGQARQLDLLLNKIVLAFQGRIRFGTATDGYKGENIQGQFQIVADTGNADTEFTVAHTLGYVPTCYIVFSNNKAGVVYKSATAWTSTNTYFKCSVANCAITLFIF
jgi:hypothetical protein